MSNIKGMNGRISEPLSKAKKKKYDAIVIGSGYGGAIAGSRLARTGKSVAILERGREMLPGDYPDSGAKAAAELQITTSQDGKTYGRADALYDLRMGNDVSVIVGCGLGGTSLINANVALGEPDLFKAEHWPRHLRDPANATTLKACFARAKKFLGSKPYRDDIRQKLPKLEALKKSSEAVLADVRARGGDGKFELPPINVTFDNGPNAFGFEQKACTLCGDCCSGCNYGAKNTTLMNYLPDAKVHGASIITGAEVMWIEKKGKSWVVHVRDLQSGKNKPPESTLTAGVVVLAAGTLGSTDILLRSRDKGLNVSKALGKRFSGNGDVLAFGYDANVTETTAASGHRSPIYGIGAGPNPPTKPEYRPGPTITGAIRLDDKATGGGVRTIEEGVMPGPLAMAYTAAFFMADALKGDLFRYGDLQLRLKDAAKLGDIIRTQPGKLAEAAYSGPLSRTQSFLVMSDDDANGVMSLKHGKLAVSWPDAGKGPGAARDNALIETACDAIWAEYLPNPLWEDKFGKKLITVHPIGGCVMAEWADDGVVNHLCQVYDTTPGLRPKSGDDQTVHDGLYVMDGSVIPGPLGTNPLLTISAIAEYAVEHLVKARKWDKLKKPRKTTIPKIKDSFTGSSTPLDGAEAILQLVILYLEDIRKKIANGDIPGAKAEILSGLELFKAYEKSIKAPLFDDKTIKSYLTKKNFQVLVAPALDEFLPILNRIKTALNAKDYAKVLSILETEMGDFSPGLSFTETMAGHISAEGLDRTHLIEDGYRIADRHGQSKTLRKKNAVTGHFKIQTADIEKMLNDRLHKASLTGKIDCKMLGGRLELGPKSSFQLLPQNETEVECWNMIYDARLKPNGKGDTYRVHGFKTLKRRPGSNWWQDLTTLSVDVFKGKGTKPIARGVMRLDLQELIGQGKSVSDAYDVKGLKKLRKDAWGQLLVAIAAAKSEWFHQDFAQSLKSKELRSKVVRFALTYAAAHGNKDIAKAVEAAYLARFGGVFAQLVFRSYGGVLAYLNDYPAIDNAKRKKAGKPARKFSAPAPKKILLHSQAHGKKPVALGLTRYHKPGASKGPVILAPGFGTTAASFAMETVDVNIVEYLTHHGYDVYLFDYRGSPALRATRQPFDIDDVARYDWPAAINKVLEISKAKKVQCLGHCVGSMTLLMRLLGDHIKEYSKGKHNNSVVRSVVSSQLSLHPVTSWFNSAKSDMGLASFLIEGAPKSMDGLIDAMKLPGGIGKTLKTGLKEVPMVGASPGKSVDPNDPAVLRDKAIDLLVWNAPFPGELPCYNPTCHRVFGVFGASYAHDQLNEATHDALSDVFGTVSSEPFKQLALIMRKGLAVDNKGSSAEFGHASRLNLPIDFIAGSKNQIFYPETTLRTLNWLRTAVKDARSDTYSRKVFPQYAHMDFFIGRNASKDVFPYILECLKSRSHGK